MGINLPTYLQNTTSKGAREAEVPTADFDEGMNKGASNAPGVGINTGSYDPKLSDWTELDQDEAARDPQNSQHLGGDGLDDGSETVVEPIRAIRDADINDTVSFVVVEANASNGQGMLSGNTGTVNRTGGPVVVGQRVWGTDTVA